MILEGKSVLITGGTGSMGKTFVRRALSGTLGAPAKVIVLSRDEAKQHNMRLEYLALANSTDEVVYSNFLRLLEFRIGDVRNFSDVLSAVRDCDVVINAAALKQVPVCEYFPEQAVLTNCGGVVNIVRAVSDHRLPVETVVAVSTDKACKPVNTMGMTKAIQERIICSANVLNPRTRFCAVRYGNVLASRGSVIPLFHEQIRIGGPVTITDLRMTRFLLSLDDAVNTVVAALEFALPGEIVIPTAPGARITDIAKILIGRRPIKTKIIGIRPGEKFDEILISEEEAQHTVGRNGYYIIRPMLPELRNTEENTERCPLKTEFSSGHSVLELEETRALLASHNLIDISATGPANEMLQ